MNLFIQKNKLVFHYILPFRSMVTKQILKLILRSLLLLVRMLSYGLCVQGSVCPALAGNEDRRGEAAGWQEDLETRKIGERHSDATKVREQVVPFEFKFSIFLLLLWCKFYLTTH